MLHDPKWNHGSLDGLITWLEGKPRGETYDFYCRGCLIGQYMEGMSRDKWPLEMFEIYRGHDKHKIGRGFGKRRGLLHTQTYGAALRRAYKAKQGEVICAS